MIDSFKFNIGQKLKIKYTVDVIFLFLIIGLIVVASFGHRLGNYDAIGLIILLLAFATQYEFTRKWVDKSLKSSILYQLNTSSKATQGIIDITLNQKSSIEGYSNLIKNAFSTIEKLKELSVKTKQNAMEVVQKSTQSLGFSKKELESVHANIEKMLTLRQQIQIIAELILELSDYTQQIGSTVGLIEDIAEQTNMLALNATVEAARAGEHGKGFSVVAGEIRKLADESKQATTKISSLIKDIQQATNSTVMATEESSKEIESGVKLANGININIESLIKTINEVTISADEICSDSEIQSEYSDNVNSFVGSINEGLSSSLKSIEDKLGKLESLNVLSEAFKDNVIDE